MARIAFLIHGGISGRKRLCRKIEKVFRPEHDLAFWFTRHRGHATELAREARTRGFTHLIVAGGDGTLNEAVNGLMEAKEQDLGPDAASLRLAVIPRGTGNDFARTIGTPEHLQGLAMLVEKDLYRTIDLGKATFSGESDEPKSRYFINITDIGLGGRVVKEKQRYTRWLGRRLGYPPAIAGALLRTSSWEVTVRSDFFKWEGEITGWVFANGKFLAGGLGIAPDAEPDNGRLALVSLGQVRLADFFQHWRALRQARPIDQPEIRYWTAREVEVDCSTGKIPIDMDGEFVGYTPLKVGLLPEALHFLCPPPKKKIP